MCLSHTQSWITLTIHHVFLIPELMSQHVTNDFYTQCKPFYAEQQLKFNRTQIKQKSIINQVLQVKGHYKLLPYLKIPIYWKFFLFEEINIDITMVLLWSKIPNIICNIYSDPRTIVLKFQKYRSNRTCVIAKKLCLQTENNIPILSYKSKKFAVI